MKVKELIQQLKKYKGDTEVYFDTEAVQFDVHLVSVTDVSFIGSGVIGLDHVILHWDHNEEKHRIREG